MPVLIRVGKFSGGTTKCTSPRKILAWQNSKALFVVVNLLVVLKPFLGLDTIDPNLVIYTLFTITKIHGSLISSEFMDDKNYTLFDFTFYQTVTITETFYPNFEGLDFLSKTGGAVGLWLGLGLVQLVEYVVIGGKMLKRFSSMK